MTTRRWGLFSRGRAQEEEGDHREFYCPITCELMLDPVVCADGTSYERTAIAQWLSTHNTSPLTGVVLPHKSLVPNLSLRALVEEYQARNGSTAVKPVNKSRNNPNGALELPTPLASAPQGAELQPMPAMDRNEARRHLINHVSSGWTTSTAAAAGCEILSCITVHPVVTKIEIFVETRERKIKHEPYVSGPLLTRADGTPPELWDIPCAEQQHFRHKTEEVELPYTSQLKTCAKCRGLGSSECTECNGTLEKPCPRCSGRASGDETTCEKCDGRGRIPCYAATCDRGVMKCTDCLGSGEVRSFEVLIRKHFTETSARCTGTTISERDLSTAKICGASGKVIYRDTALHVIPPSDFTGEVREITRAVEEASSAKVAKVTGQGDRVLQQRLTVTQVPITLTKGHHEGQNFHWYVYGNDYVVSVFGYPNNCCEWCNRCTIS